MNLREIQNKIQRGQRLGLEDGAALFESNDIIRIGKLAHAARHKLHGRRVYYSVNYHLNHTNICKTGCDFCAFSRKGSESDAYTLSIDEIENKIEKAVSKWGVNEVHMVGGHNPALGFEYYRELFSRIRSRFPVLFIKALTASEIHDISERSGIPVEEVLKGLREAGLNSLPGGGAEIFDPEIRRRICPGKISGDEWLRIHRTAHRIGIPTNATMLYGHLEKAHDRVEHMLRLRALQDETKGFRAFVPIAFRSPKSGTDAGIRACGSVDDGFLHLKVLSIARLMLDNIPHLRVHWPATDLKFAQAALSFGPDHIGGTNLNEKVIRDAGGSAAEGLSSGDLVRFIREAGFEPVEIQGA
ncbi:MAG: Aminodeoxyfutalosine synthase [Candidatus Omnitrophica bacterium ADurb.Bin277]|nr:MAG: Aminodeoxyfutalosine synthase [Candidatus Omnitrophica bacterium ADurb.Bin277]